MMMISSDFVATLPRTSAAASGGPERMKSDDASHCGSATFYSSATDSQRTARIGTAQLQRTRECGPVEILAGQVVENSRGGSVQASERRTEKVSGTETAAAAVQAS